MKAFHDHMGHPGKERMLGVLKRRYYWPGMDHSIRDYVDECHECTLAKPYARHNAKPRKPRQGHYPFDVLYVDVLLMKHVLENQAKRHA